MEDVRLKKAITLTSHYESFSTKEGESMEDMFERLQVLLNNLEALGLTYTKAQINLKVVNNFPKVWEPKKIAIQEARDFKNLAWDELLGILRVHEVHLQNKDHLQENYYAIVTTYPSAGRRRGAHGCIFHGRTVRGVATNVYLRKTSEKSERCGLRTLIVKGSGVIFTHREGISTSRIRHKGRQPLIKCANMTSECFIFPFFMSLCVFLSFCGRQGCFPRSYVSSIAMRKSNLLSSFSTKCWLSCFDLFSQDRF